MRQAQPEIRQVETEGIILQNLKNDNSGVELPPRLFFDKLTGNKN